MGTFRIWTGSSAATVPGVIAAKPPCLNGAFEAGTSTSWATAHLEAAPLTGFRTGSADDWANNPTGFLSNNAAWNVAFATVESTAAGGGIGAPGFGQGVVIGNLSGAYLYMTDSVWATTYLQAAGGPAGALSATHGNGVTTTTSGDFGHQVLALKFNVDFSNPPSGSNVAVGYYLPTGFGTLRITATATSLDGLTVAQVLAAANLALGGQRPTFTEPI